MLWPCFERPTRANCVAQPIYRGSTGAWSRLSRFPVQQDEVGGIGRWSPGCTAPWCAGGPLGQLVPTTLEGVRHRDGRGYVCGGVTRCLAVLPELAPASLAQGCSRFDGRRPGLFDSAFITPVPRKKQARSLIPALSLASCTPRSPAACAIETPNSAASLSAPTELSSGIH